MALGATRRRIVRTLLKQAVRQIAAVLAVGALLAYALTRLLTSSIAGFPTVDYPSLVYLSAVVFLGTIGLIAVLIPAMRGAKVDPMEALRCE